MQRGKTRLTTVTVSFSVMKEWPALLSSDWLVLGSSWRDTQVTNKWTRTTLLQHVLICPFPVWLHIWLICECLQHCGRHHSWCCEHLLICSVLVYLCRECSCHIFLFMLPLAIFVRFLKRLCSQLLQPPKLNTYINSITRPGPLNIFGHQITFTSMNVVPGYVLACLCL